MFVEKVLSKSNSVTYFLFTGHGNEKGGIVTKIFNEGQKPLKIVYLDIIPWFLRVYLHTLKVTKSNGKAQKPLKLNFQPGVDRKKPYR